MLHFIGPGKCYLDYGPVQMYITAVAPDKPLHEELKTVKNLVHNLLEDLSTCLDQAKLPAGELDHEDNRPVIFKAMLKAVTAAGDPSLTPMAAVAGSFSDAVAAYLLKKGATYLIVNNGGDIAFYQDQAQKLKIGLKPDLSQERCSHFLTVNKANFCPGIATSGLGGRGFTMGIASSVTILAPDSATADACATLIANKTTVDDPAVVKVPAEIMDPQTDLRGKTVTVECTSLKAEQYLEAIQSGLTATKILINNKVIKGAVLFAGPYISAAPEILRASIEPLSQQDTAILNREGERLCPTIMS